VKVCREFDDVTLAGKLLMTSATLCTIVLQKLNLIAFNTSRTLLPVLLLLLLDHLMLTSFLNLHWLRVPKRIEYKIASTTYKLLQYSSPQYLRDLITIQPSRSTRSSSVVTCSFSLVSKSPIALSATQHAIFGTDFLHHSDYHVPPLHLPVVHHSLNLLLACHIRCCTLVSKLTFSPGFFLP